MTAFIPLDLWKRLASEKGTPLLRNFLMRFHPHIIGPTIASGMHFRPPIASLRTAFLILTLGAVAIGLSAEPGAGMLIKSGEKIVFLGDSITRQGAGAEGWCTLVVSSLKTFGIDTEAVNAGRGGNTSRDMAARFENDVISKKPAWMTLMCGTNDNPNHGLSLEESKKNIRTIVETAQAAGIKILMLTMPVRGGNLHENAYNAFIREFAQEKNIPLADVFAEMKKTLVEYKAEHPGLLPNSPPLLTVADGTHMNPRGNQVIAECVLTAFGLSPEQISKVKANWPSISTPGSETPNVQQ